VVILLNQTKLSE